MPGRASLDRVERSDGILQGAAVTPSDRARPGPWVFGPKTHQPVPGQRLCPERSGNHPKSNHVDARSVAVILNSP